MTHNAREARAVCRHAGYFVDLFVRKSNKLAIGMYEKLGYAVHRRVLGYYSGADAEDALGASTCTHHGTVAILTRGCVTGRHALCVTMRAALWSVGSCACIAPHSYCRGVAGSSAASTLSCRLLQQSAGALADMRKAMPRDRDKESMVPLKKPIRPEDLEFD